MSIWLNTTEIVSPHTEKPCHKLGWCPYGQLVEEFPLYPTAREYAVEHNLYSKFAPGGWVPCDKADERARPDINRALEGMEKKGIKEHYSCKVFGHDCPAFYHREDLAEEVELRT